MHRAKFRNHFQQSCLKKDECTIGIELPFLQNEVPDTFSRFINEAGEDGRIAAIALTASQATAGCFTGLMEEMHCHQMAPLLYFSMSHHNRLALFQQLEELGRQGLNNLLVVSGDYPAVDNNLGNAKPVFDFDSVQMLHFLSGKLPACSPTATSELSSIYRGCALHPAKILEAEVIGQYAKLLLKLKAGAEYVVVQAGTDMRKYQEAVFFLRERGIRIPVLAALDHAVFTGEPPQLTGKKDLSLMSKTIAVLRGIGLQGVILRNPPPDFARLASLLDASMDCVSRWEEFLPEIIPSRQSFYLYEKNRQTGLNAQDRTPLEGKKLPHPVYLVSWLIDWIAFDQRGPLFKTAGRLFLRCEKKQPLKNILIFLEQVTKGLLYGCTMCGDCKLYSSGFLCPHAGCPKQLLNGPCGGSIDGYCELYPGERLCFWVQVFDRLKNAGKPPFDSLVYIPPKDWRLDKSSWINFFAGRDHRHIEFRQKR